MRTFIGLNLSLAVTRRIAEEVERHKAGVGAAKVAWVPAANLHVTLKFLGSIKEELLDGIAGRLGRIKQAPFEVKARGFGAFPSGAKPNVLWVGVDGGDALLNLQREVEVAMAGLGFPREERAFHPHLTVGRVKESSGPLTWASEADLGSSMVNELVVYESKTLQKGAEYVARARVGLTK